MWMILRFVVAEAKVAAFFYVVVSFRYWELLCRFLLDHKRIGYDFEATRDVRNNLFEGVEGLGA